MARIRKKVAVTSRTGGVGRKKRVLTTNLAPVLAAEGWRVGDLDADLNGPSMAKVLGVRGQRLRFSPDGLQPAEGPLGIKLLSTDLFLEDRAPLTGEVPTQQDAFV